MDKQIGIIGFGNMGRAIAERIKQDCRVIVFDKDESKINSLNEILVSRSLSELIEASAIVILAVKPQDLKDILAEIKNLVKDKLIISIAAGISTGYIEHYLGKVRVIRAMPNMLAKIGESITCMTKGEFASEEDLALSEELFKHIGLTLKIEERLMDGATAVSGNGPAYVCDYIEAEVIDTNHFPEAKKTIFLAELISAAQGVGFSKKVAEFLVRNTFSSTIDFLKITKITPQELKKQVASKGGATEAALAARHKGASWLEALEAAVKRGQELSKRE